MSNEELKRIKLDCLTDFQRAAMLYLNGGGYMVFFKHGMGLLKKINRDNLVKECLKVNEMISAGEKKNKVADRLLTVGLMASC